MPCVWRGGGESIQQPAYLSRRDVLDEEILIRFMHGRYWWLVGPTTLTLAVTGEV